MNHHKLYTVIFFGTLIGSTLCVIPDGEIQIGPIFGKGSRIFGGGHKQLEAVFQKGAHLKPIIAKKVLLGVGAVGAAAAAVGGAALLAKKFPHLGHGHGHGWGWGGSNGYAQGHYNNYQQASYGGGWGSGATDGYYPQAPSAVTDVKFPASSYSPTSASYYPSTQYGYPQQNDWQASGGYGGSFGLGGSGWSR